MSGTDRDSVPPTHRVMYWRLTASPVALGMEGEARFEKWDLSNVVRNLQKIRKINEIDRCWAEYGTTLRQRQQTENLKA